MTHVGTAAFGRPRVEDPQVLLQTPDLGHQPRWCQIEFRLMDSRKRLSPH